MTDHEKEIRRLNREKFEGVLFFLQTLQIQQRKELEDTEKHIDHVRSVINGYRLQEAAEKKQRKPI